MTTTIYGIANCDTVKKARRWLEEQSINYQFHDLRKDGLSAAQASAWLAELGWETLINKRSTSWRELDATSKEQLDQQGALQLILKQPTLIKRPLLEHNGQLETGFKPEIYARIFR